MTRGALIVVSGLPGVGKTTVAAEIAIRLHGVHLSVDPVEDAMLASGLPRGWTVGVAAYEAVAAMVSSNLALGSVVVVDAVNDSEAARHTWRRLVGPDDAAAMFVVLTCSDLREHRRRLEGRRRDLINVREPSWSEVLARSRGYEPWSGEYLDLDTAHLSVTDVVDEVCERIRTE